MKMLVGLIKRVSGQLHVWALCQEARTTDPVETKRIARRELDAISESIGAHFDYQKREQEILSDRLARRFDIGMAMNEAANRAIEEKAAVKVRLSSTQEKALEFQKAYLDRLVKNS